MRKTYSKPTILRAQPLAAVAATEVTPFIPIKALSGKTKAIG